nr:glycosyltransferase family 2 protein [Zoogloeaceae bacterium]
MQEPAVSILIPVYNEAEVLPLCFAKLNEVLVNLDLTYELIFVDDGSNDGSGACLAALVAIQDNVKVISLSRNFGKEAAMSAGLAYTRGAATIILDADLQDPPELIPEMIQAW